MRRPPVCLSCAQLNGAWGIDFCAPGDHLVRGLRLVAHRLLAHGVTAFLPTLITSSPETYRAILPHLVPTRGSADGAAVLGVHLEGPFISQSKPGCHPPQHIFSPDADATGGASTPAPAGWGNCGAGAWCRCSSDTATAASGALAKTCVGTGDDAPSDLLRRYYGDHLAHVRLVTLAPELPGARRLIAELLSRGVVVSAGHSNGSSAELDSALKWGVSMVTHLFNAMPPFHPREPGIVGLLGSTSHPRPYLGLISDGVHVHPACVQIAATARPDDIVLVSDGVTALGLPSGTHTLGDVGEVTVEGDRAYRAGTKTLAGAVVALDECVRRFRRYARCTAARALESASLHPAAVLGHTSSKGTLAVGADADLILLDDELHVHATYVRGVRAWSKVDGFATAEDENVDEGGAMSGGSQTPTNPVDKGGGSGRVVPPRGSKRKQR